MSAIPLEYLKKIGSYRNMKVHGETVTVIADAAETSALTESRIADFRSHLVRNNVKVVGVDSKEKKEVCLGSTNILSDYVLVLYAGNRCYIFHYGVNYVIPESLLKIFRDPNICFVGSFVLNQSYYKSMNSEVISAGKLAAMVLKKPGLTTSALASIAKEAGIQYDGPSFESKAVIEVDWRNPKVLTAEMVKIAINDAVAHYLIGCKLFKMLDDN
ncbi:Ribulose bisphosphate carboxylase-like protein [Bienertia sinuspersici]